MSEERQPEREQDQGQDKDGEAGGRGARRAPVGGADGTRMAPGAGTGTHLTIRDAAWVPELGEMRRIALLYASRGWSVVPLRPGSKAPAVARWTELRLDAKGIAKHFGGGRPNVGVLTGAASGGLVDVDCDTPEAALAAAVLLPPTPIVSGRAGHPRSHYWYIIEGELPRTTKYAWDARGGEGPADASAPRGVPPQRPPARPGERGAATGISAPPSPRRAETRPGGEDRHRGMLVELRADGCQTLLPPSRHPSGERVVWERGADRGSELPAHDHHGGLKPGESAAGETGTSVPAQRAPVLECRERDEPARVTADELRRAVGRVAAAALLARHWPGRGTRDETALALCGMLLRAGSGWGEEETDLFVRTVARIAGDEEWRERGSKAKGTRRRLDAGKHVWGARELARKLSAGDGAAVVRQARAWLFGTVPPDDDTSGGNTPDGSAGDAACVGAHGVRPLAGVRPGDMDARDLGQPDMPLSFGTRLSEYATRPLRPLWGGRLYLGKLTLLDGDPELGKSYVALDLAARITTGRPMPDGSPPALEGPAGVVYLSAEDDPADTLRPRLEAAGGDPAWVQHLNMAERLDRERNVARARPLTLRDLDIIRGAVRETAARLVVVDPFAGFLDDKTNSYRDQDVRAILAPLALLAQEVEAAFLIIRHLNKTAGTKALYRGGGSIGIIGAARVGLYAARDPDDPQRERVVLACSKSNLGPRPPAVVYRIGTRQPTDDAESAHGAAAPAVVEWLGTSAHTADALALSEMGAAGAGETSALGEAVAFLREALADGPQLGESVKQQARAAGISGPTLRRARVCLGVLIRRQRGGDEGRSHWELPSPASTSSTPSSTSPDGDGTRDHDDYGDHGQSLNTLITSITSPRGPHQSAPADTDSSAGEGARAAGESRGAPAPASAPAPHFPAPDESELDLQGAERAEAPSRAAIEAPTGPGDQGDQRVHSEQCDHHNHVVAPVLDGPTAPDASSDYAVSVYLLEQRARSQSGRGCVECELAFGDEGDVCVPARDTATQPGATGAARPEDDAVVQALIARGMVLDSAAAPCPKTGGAHQYALQRDVHYHPVCVECGQADLTRTVRDPADARRFAGKERAE